MSDNASIITKAKRRIDYWYLNKIEGTAFQFGLYRSYWHYKLSGKKNQEKLVPGIVQYLSQEPTGGAGIGHQLANWNSGYYFAKFFHLQFAHFPFSNKKWEDLLGFGEHEKTSAALLKDRRFKKIKLPRFDSTNKDQVELIGKIIQSYKNKNVFFLLERDQGYMQQADTAGDLSAKFFAAPARTQNKLFYNQAELNIAVHIRRGDIVTLAQTGKAQGALRWLNNDYYVKVLSHVLAQVRATIPANKTIRVYLFSQGTKEDFPEFEPFPNIQFCLDTNAYDSFLHLTYADILISSKSSFSYKPALISKGIKIVPETFWHGYPATSDFILADNDGNFDTTRLAALKIN